MPFKSAKQRAYLAVNEPKVFEDWAKKYGYDIEPKKKKNDKEKKRD